MKKYLCRVLKSSTNLEKEFTRADDALVWAGRWAVQGDAVIGISYNAGQYDDPWQIGVRRDGDKIVVRTYRRDPLQNEQQQFDNIGDAQAWVIANVEIGVEGFDVLSLEQPIGSGPTALLYHAPPRLMSYYQGEFALHQVFTLIGGTHGRSDEFTPPDATLTAEETASRKDLAQLSPDLQDAFRAWLTVYNAKVPAGAQVTVQELKAEFLAIRNA